MEGDIERYKKILEDARQKVRKKTERNMKIIKLREKIQPWLKGALVWLVACSIGIKIGLKVELIFLAGYLSWSVSEIISDFILRIFMPIKLEVE